MSKYIDIEAFDDWYDDGYDLYAYYEALHNAPSMDIVRCAECKYYKQSEAFCENGNGLWQAGDECFCSYGERKESE